MSWKNKPFLLRPTGKDYLWGGSRLNTDFHKQIDLTPLAETWECSTHPDGVSTVMSGEHRGKPLDLVLTEHPEYLGSHPAAVMRDITPRAGASDRPGSLDRLPVLVKLIDAAQDLSVQVHPNDAFAYEYEDGSLGKTEMWYILDAEPGAYLFYGFERDMDEELLRQSLKQKTIEKYLQKIPVQKDDVFYIEAGTVHAIGAGILLAEIQENSNLTYRLFDYDRSDKNGKKRPLHIEKALQVLNYKSSDSPRQPMRVLRYQPGCASELLCRCKYFQVERLLVNTKKGQTHQTTAPEFAATEHSFQILLCLEGEGKLHITKEEPSADDTELPFAKGNTVFIPANSAPMRLDGRAQLLKISC